MNDASHPAIFTTNTQYVLPAQKYMIPATWRRYQLSQLINKVLDLPQPVPFDFLIRGEVIRDTIRAWCTEHGVGEEETLEIEYIESLMPPQRTASLPQDDWISSVSCQVPECILAASYDGNVRLFDSSQKPIHVIPGHTAPVTSACWVHTTDNDVRILASASHDRTARLVRVPTSIPESTPQALASLHLHSAPLSSVASDLAGTLLLTAGWDCLLGVWDTSIPETHEVPPEEDRKKRRRVEESQVMRKAPLHVMKSHTGRVSRALFARNANTPHTAYSCGLDSTLRTWDISLGACSGTITLNEKPLTDLTLLADAHTALCPSTDRTLVLFDLRASTPASSSTFGHPHPALPSAVAAHPTDPHRAMSAAYDGIVRVWDLRSVRAPIVSFKTGEEQGGGKLLSVDWGKGVGAVGGEDGVEVWKMGERDERIG